MTKSSKAVISTASAATSSAMFAGITIVNIDGTYLGLGNVIRRNVLGYLITVVTLGLGFMISGINQSGRALHDLVGGTIVIRGRRNQISI